MDVPFLRNALVSSLLLAGLPMAQAHTLNHGAPETLKSFVPAPADQPYQEVLLQCVSQQDTDSGVLLSGLGGTRYPLVSLQEPGQVEAFYSQGMALQYGFNFSEAIRAFYHASRFDKDAAMPYWGIALAANSNINSDATDGCDRLAYRSAQTALERAQSRLQNPAAKARFSERQLQREVDYAKAFLTQYSEQDGKVSLSKEGNQRYADAMKALSQTYFDDLDAATLHADALLNLTPWKWWDGDEAVSDKVAPTPAAYEALQVLNRVLVQDQQHTGANHFYIHAIEESPFPDSGLPMADRFRVQNPAIGHLVHMASHIYQRTGNNALASTANYTAVAVDRAYAHQVQPQSPYPLHYLGHNIHFLTWTLSIEGRQNEALNMAEELVENTTQYSALAFLCRQYPKEIATKSDYFYAVPYYFAVRFEDWDALARIEPKITEGLKTINTVCSQATQGDPTPWNPLVAPYTGVMRAYALAYRQLTAANLSNDQARDALKGYWQAVVDALKAHPNLAYGNNPAVELFRIANLILLNKAQDGRQGQLDLVALKATANQVMNPEQPLNADLQALDGNAQQQVLSAWRKAVQVQDALSYNEPPDWYYTLRESLGYALLEQGQYAEAERVFREDLAGNRLSGRSLNGLKLSLEKQPGSTVPALLEEQLQTAWRNATVPAAPKH
jgi:tetratricopeptide (TPR) repeat protein